MPADPRDIYTWKAIYKDGRVLNQYNEDGTKNKYREIDRVDLSKFSLISIETGKTVVTVNLSRNKRLIWRMRVAKPFGQRFESVRVHLVGWQMLYRGKNSQLIHAVFPDGSIETVDRWSDNHEWLYPVVFNEAERIE
jgi:hypothetical protein